MPSNDTPLATQSNVLLALGLFWAARNLSEPWASAPWTKGNDELLLYFSALVDSGKLERDDVTEALLFYGALTAWTSYLASIPASAAEDAIDTFVSNMEAATKRKAANLN